MTLLQRLVVALCLPAGLAAQDTTAVDPRAAMPERPTVATHAGTVAPGYLEVESGVELDRYRAAGDKALGYSTVLKLGVATSVQLDLMLVGQQGVGPLRTPMDCGVTGPCGARTIIPAGVGDPSVALKVRLANDHPLLGDFAIQTGLKLPIGDAKLTTHTTDLSVLLISSRDIGPVHIDVNIGATFRDGDGTNAPTLASVWTASFGGTLMGPVGWTAELFGYPATSGVAGAPSSMAILAGPNWTLNTRVVLDLGIIHRLSGEQPTASFLGVTANLGRLW